MSLVATLISHPARKSIGAGLATSASAALGATSMRWLAHGVALDLFSPEASDAAVAQRILADMVGDAPLDMVVQPAETRRKRILIADMDSTMIDQECIDELADEVGLKDKVAAITARSMNNEIAFEPALRERVALLKGLDSGVVERIIAGRITLASGGREVVATMRAHGAWTALVSGGFTVFTSRIAAMLGFDENHANTLGEADGFLTGTVAEPILGREAKAGALRDIAALRGIPVADALAVGDGANDLDMLALAGTGVALHAKPAVAAKARVRIDHGDLTALLYLQGYADAEFCKMIPLRTPRLIIRNWRDSDRDFFHRINSDDTVMEFFPFRRDRAQADALMDEIRADINANGYGWTAVELSETGQCIGFVGISPAEIEPIVPHGSTEIGWRLAPEFWSHGYVMEAATALLDNAFGPLGMDEIISFAVTTNARSIAVMRRLGMTRDEHGDFDHPSVPDTHPHLKRFVLYRLKKQEWLNRR